MVWDRQTNGLAKFQGRRVIGLPENRAWDIKDELTKQ
jgi:hypothetical protein